MILVDLIIDLVDDNILSSYQCLTVIAKNFCYIYDADYCFLPLSLFMKIVHHPTLAIKSERALYDIIRNYVAHHRGKEEEERLKQVHYSIF